MAVPYSTYGPFFVILILHLPRSLVHAGPAPRGEKIHSREGHGEKKKRKEKEEGLPVHSIGWALDSDTKFSRSKEK